MTDREFNTELTRIREGFAALVWNIEPPSRAYDSGSTYYERNERPIYDLRPICPVCNSQRVGELYEEYGDLVNPTVLSYTCQECGFTWTHAEHTNYTEEFAARIEAAREGRK